MNDLLALFRDLEPLAEQTPGKPDPHENVTDILEMVAVAVGIRHAHLQGQGQHDQERLAAIERITSKHGLITIRSRTVIPFIHRPRRYDQRIIEFEDGENLTKQRESPEVVWVCADESVVAAIPDVVAGRTAVSDVLGYPNCCVTHCSEQNVTLAEAYVQGIIDTHHHATPDEVLALWQRDVQVPVTVDPDADIPQTRASLERFPYVQFVACPACVIGNDSPAAQVNRRMRELAFELSPSLGRRIWETRDLVISKGRRISVGRNDPCPCGRGAKFKKCCDRIRTTN